MIMNQLLRIQQKKIQIHFRLGCIFKKHLLSVKSAGIIPFIVFDGLFLPGKAGEVEQRQRFDLGNVYFKNK